MLWKPTPLPKTIHSDNSNPWPHLAEYALKPDIYPHPRWRTISGRQPGTMLINSTSKMTPSSHRRRQFLWTPNSNYQYTGTETKGLQLMAPFLLYACNKVRTPESSWTNWKMSVSVHWKLCSLLTSRHWGNKKIHIPTRVLTLLGELCYSVPVSWISLT